jgi:hypothetical protein
VILRDLEIHAYHESSRISNSKLHTLEDKGPRGFKLAHIDRAWSREDTEAFQAGRITEDLIQRPWTLERYVVRPEGMDFRKPEGKAWKKEQLAAGREVVEAGAITTAKACIATLPEHPYCQALVADAEMQLTVAHDKLAQWPHVPGLQCRPDWLCIEGAAASEWRPYSLDLKTTGDFDSLCFGKGLTNFGYHRQAALARLCLALEGVAGWREFKFFLLVAEKAFPQRWCVVEIPDELLDRGERWAMRQLTRLDAFYARNEWPLVESEHVVAPVPKWPPASEAA